MMPLFSYDQKHDQSQVGDKEISQEEFEADKIPYLLASNYASRARRWDESMDVKSSLPNSEEALEALKKAPRPVKKRLRKAMEDANAFSDRATLRVGGTVSPESKKETKENTNRLISQLKKKIPGF